MRTMVLLRARAAPLVAAAMAGLGFHPAPDAPSGGVHVTDQDTGRGPSGREQNLPTKANRALRVVPRVHIDGLTQPAGCWVQSSAGVSLVRS